MEDLDLVMEYKNIKDMLSLVNGDNYSNINQDMVAIELLKIKREERALADDDNFVSVSRKVIDASPLSWTAKGIYLYMLSLPEGTILTHPEIVEASGNKTSNAEVFDAIIELEVNGLIG